MSIRLRSEPISRDLPDVMAVNSSDQLLNGVTISWRKTFLLIRVRFRVAENLRSARSSLSFFSKVLAARKTNLITCPELAKINALLACSQRPFITPHTAQSSSSVVGLFLFFSFCRIFTTTWCPLFRVSEDQVCLWFVSIIFLPNSKEKVPFQFIHESHGKQELISWWKWHAKPGARSNSELRFSENRFLLRKRFECNSHGSIEA